MPTLHFGFGDPIPRGYTYVCEALHSAGSVFRSERRYHPVAKRRDLLSRRSMACCSARVFQPQLGKAGSTRYARPAFASPKHKLCLPSRSRRATVVYARYTRPDLTARVLSAVMYVIPFCDSFQYARFIFVQVPEVYRLIRPVLPVVSWYHSIPFAPMICFFGVYSLIVNNYKMDRFTRFNALQALLLDILLVLPRLVESLFTPPTIGWGAKVYIASQNAIWTGVFACVVLGAFFAIMGTSLRIPFVGEAADQQLR